MLAAALAGHLVFAVKSTGCMGTGLDVSASAIGSGRARASAAGVQDRVALLEADLNLPIPFGGSSFDAAISLDVVVHFRNRKALPWDGETAGTGREAPAHRCGR
jgi:cyclopropane fatty-acyl-phospholipid synthase-like methyltransferase